MSFVAVHFITVVLNKTVFSDISFNCCIVGVSVKSLGHNRGADKGGAKGCLIISNHILLL